VELRDVLLSATDQVESRALPEPAPLRSEERLATVVRSVVAETLANVRKHADPSEVTIVVQGADDGVTIDLLNDGVRAAGTGHRGVGLRLAAVKASSAGATLEAGPDNSGEWRVHVCVGR
jgi:signal transduction histidine kinase